MISFRFHVVSLTAVFLAIAIGVVVGSTFIDRAIVDNLEERIDNVSANLDDRRAEIARLEDEIGRLEDFGAGVESFAVSGRLTEQPVLVVAPRGVDEDVVRSLVSLAGVAGADAPGVLWVEPRWALGDEGATADLADLVDGVGGDDPADEVRAEAWAAALDELVAPPEPDPEVTDPEVTDPEVTDPEVTDPTVDPPLDPTTTETTEPPVDDEPPEVEILTSLLESGFVSFEPVADGATLESVADRSPAVVVVTGTEVEADLAGTEQALVAGLLDAELATVVAEVFVPTDEDDTDEGDETELPERGEAATAAVPDGDATELAVVDHLDLPMGRVAAVLAVADLGRGVVGRYGVGDGAAGVVPAWTPL